MTTNSSARRADVLGIHSLDHFCRAAPDLEPAASFYDSFGLKLAPQGQSLGLYTQEQSHRWGLLIEGARKQLHHLSFGVFEDDLPKFRERLRARNIPLLPPPRGFDDSGLWFLG